MKPAAAIALLLAWTGLAGAGKACDAPGAPVHWVADYCMLRMETDDEIAAAGCIEQELKTRFASACAGKIHYKTRMCATMIGHGTRVGSLAQCVKDPGFKGRTVERGGVGG